jgi:hypothetical protein
MLYSIIFYQFLFMSLFYYFPPARLSAGNPSAHHFWMLSFLNLATALCAIKCYTGCCGFFLPQEDLPGGWLHQGKAFLTVIKELLKRINLLNEVNPVC